MLVFIERYLATAGQVHMCGNGDCGQVREGIVDCLEVPGLCLCLPRVKASCDACLAHDEFVWYQGRGLRVDWAFMDLAVGRDAKTLRLLSAWCLSETRS